MKIEQRYIAEDGTAFVKEDECLKYEKFILETFDQRRSRLFTELKNFCEENNCKFSVSSGGSIPILNFNHNNTEYTLKLNLL